MSRHRSLLVTTSLLLAGFGASCARSAGPQAGAATAGSTPPPVDVTTVISQPLAVITPLPGELRPLESVAVFSKVAGFVKTITVDRGSRVTQGEVIAHLDAPELTAQKAEADAKVLASQAQLAAAQAKLAADEGTLSRLKAASATAGVVAGNDLDVAARAVDADRAQVAAQQEAVAAGVQNRQAITQMTDYLDVRAPFDGVVTERNVHPGALVAAGAGAEPLVRIEMQTTLRLVVPVPEAYAAGVTTGRRVEFSVASYPGRMFSGSVARISHSVDAKTRTMAVEIAVANAAGELSPGVFCDVRWPVERPAATLFVPPTSVTSTLERTFVVRIRDGKVEWVDVVRGASSGKLVEVFGADLHAGDHVAMRGTDELRVGMTVTARVVEVK